MSLVSPQFKQLPMFMTAREIRSEYQALDADRRTVNPRGRTVMAEVRHQTGVTLDEIKKNHGPWSKETDDALFARKADESTLTADEVDNTGALSVSTADSVREQGVRNPVSLQWDPKRVGQFGKPEILGGHHRVALMEKHRPNDLMPVQHFNDMHQAQDSLGDRY